MAVWRAHIITSGGRPDVDPVRFCMDKAVVGIGWQVDANAPLTAEAYLLLAAHTYPDDNGVVAAFRAIHNRMAVDDLCWTQ